MDLAPAARDHDEKMELIAYAMAEFLASIARKR